MLDVKDLRLIQALYEHKTFTRAARALQIPQPALSRHLMLLERKLGRQLFIRRRSGSIPTDLGRTIINKGESILIQLDEIETTIAGINGKKLSEISIVSGSFTTETLLTEVAARAISAFPATQLTLKSTNWTDIETDILDRKSSIGLLHLSGQIFDSSLSVEKLGSHPILFFCPPRSPAHGTEIHHLGGNHGFPGGRHSAYPKRHLKPAGGSAKIHQYRAARASLLSGGYP